MRASDDPCALALSDSLSRSARGNLEGIGVRRTRRGATMSSDAGRAKAFFFAGLFTICMCGLMLQIIETRILSVISWYHLAFLAISLAMFGMTAGSLYVYFRPAQFTRERL